MEKTLWTPGMWAGMGALVAALFLLAGTGTCVASGATNAELSVKMAAAAPLDRGDGFGNQETEARRVRTLQEALKLFTASAAYARFAELGEQDADPISTSAEARGSR